MSIFETDFTQNLVPALGKPTGFWENVKQGYDQQYRVDSPYSLEAELRDSWKETLDLYEQEFGEAPSFDTNSLGSYNSYARTVLGEDISFWQRNLFTGEPTAELKGNIKAFQELNEKIKGLNDPRFKSFEQVLEDVFQLQREVEERSNLFGETGGTAGAIGQFLGAVGGTFTTRDPITLATLGIGGIGKTVAARVITGGAAAGGVVGVQEAAAVLPNRELADLPERSLLFSVAAGAVAGGAFEGLGQVISRFVSSKRAKRQQAVEAAQREALRTQLEEMDTPGSRGALHIMDQEDLILRSSPYGQTRTGLKRFTGELEEISAVMAGRTDTAIGRALPVVPYEQLEKTFDFQIVKEQSPEIYAPLERAQQRLKEIDEEVAEIESAIDATTVADAISLVDAEQGAKVRAAVEALEELPEGSPARANAELEINTAVQRVGGVETVARALEDAEIAPRERLKTLRKSRRAENRRYKKALSAVETESQRLHIARVQQEAAEKRQLEQLLGTAAQTTGTPVRLSSTNGEVAVALANRLEKIEPEIDKQADEIIRNFDEEAPDLGLADEVDLDMEFIDEAGNVITVRQAIEELKKDQQLDEAMRSCAL